MMENQEIGDERFLRLLTELADLHRKKATDYGRGVDPLANLRGSSEWGIEPWRAALCRLGDKVHRLKAFAQKGSLANEDVEDSLLDLASYSLLALILWREEHEKPKSKEEDKLFEEEIKVYDEKLESFLRSGVDGYYALIKGDKVWVDDSYEKALAVGYERYGLDGKFLIRKIEPKKKHIMSPGLFK